MRDGRDEDISRIRDLPVSSDVLLIEADSSQREDDE